MTADEADGLIISGPYIVLSPKQVVHLIQLLGFLSGLDRMYSTLGLNFVTPPLQPSITAMEHSLLMCCLLHSVFF